MRSSWLLARQRAHTCFGLCRDRAHVRGIGLQSRLSSFPCMDSRRLRRSSGSSGRIDVSTGPKAAAFAVLLRVMFQANPPGRFWLIWVSAVLTMTLGNLGALVQNNVKRLLAYSSIAHAGYLLVAFAAIPELGSPQPCSTPQLTGDECRSLCHCQSLCECRREVRHARRLRGPR